MIQQTPITCEHVFQRLTAGPFCADANGDHEIELHLSCCSECHKLAEAMRPAIGLLHETLDEKARIDLPVYLADQSGRPSEIMDVIRAELDQCAQLNASATCGNGKRSVGTRSKLNTVSWVLVATLLLGLLGMTALWLSAYQDKENHVAANPPQSPTILQALESGESGENQLASFAASTTCESASKVTQTILHSHSQDLSFLDLKALCCTECHYSGESRPGSDGASRIDVALIASACSQCHGVSDKVN